MERVFKPSLYLNRKWAGTFEKFILVKIIARDFDSPCCSQKYGEWLVELFVDLNYVLTEMTLIKVCTV